MTEFWALTNLRVPGSSGNNDRIGEGPGRAAWGTLIELGSLVELGSAYRIGVAEGLEALGTRRPSRLRGWAFNPAGRRSLQNVRSGPGDPDWGVNRKPQAKAVDPGPGLSGRPAPQSSPDCRPGLQKALNGPVGRAHCLLSPGAQHCGRAGSPPPPPLSPPPQPPPLSPRIDRSFLGLLRRRNPRLKNKFLGGQ